MKKLIFSILLFSLNSCVSTGMNTFSDENFSTPEAAITHFVSGIEANNLNSALEACAIDEYAENFSFRKLVDRLEVISFWSFSAPSEYRFYADINRAEQTNLISRQIKFFCFSMLSTEKIYDKMIVTPEGGRVDNFIKSSDPSKLSGLRIVRFIVPRPDLINSERNQKNWKALAAVYGADTKTERLVLYELNGKFYVGGFSLLKYGNVWKIESMASVLANTDYFGSVKEVLSEEIEGISRGYFPD